MALHLAARALRAGECSMALAGGAAVMATPDVFVEFSRQRGLAPDGRVKAFSDSADGTAWSEGASLLLLERLSDARRNGHPVLAVVRGSAVNQDGASNGLTAPSGSAQRAVIRRALADAGVAGADVDVVEAHGTGTRLGDPIEASAIVDVYGRERVPGRPVWLGSLKSNIGHVQAAAGVAGVIKMVLAMRAGVLPATLHVTAPTSEVDWSEGGVELLTAAREWPEVGRPRRAAVSSFGVSGTNAHVIIEQAEDDRSDDRPQPAGTVVPWVVSGNTSEAVRIQADRLASHVSKNPELSPLDVAFSLATGRAGLAYRAAVVTADREEALAGLRAVMPEKVAAGGVAVLFSGQGSQRVGMGRDLAGVFPVFRGAFDEVAGVVDPLLGCSLWDVLAGDGLGRTEFTQPALFGVEVALFRLLESWGLRPDFVGGHSVGELTAAFVAGVWSLEDAGRLVVARGRLMQGLSEGGVMVAVGVGEDVVVPLLGEGVDVAAVNGPSSVVLSGDEAAVRGVVAGLGEGVRVRRLAVSHAFHSARMDPMLDDFRRVAESVSYRAPSLRLVSNVTGDGGGGWGSAQYWVSHARAAVRFADGVGWLVDQGVRTFVEVGPGSVLTALTRECLADRDASATGSSDGSGFGCVPVLRSGVSEVRSVVAAVGSLFTCGVGVDWAGFFKDSGARRVDVPTYAFGGERYWLERSVGGDVSSVGVPVTEHALIGAVVTIPEGGGAVGTGRLGVGSHPWLADHMVGGVVVVPGAVLVEMAMRVGAEVGTEVVEELVMGTPLVAADSVWVRVVVGAEEAAGRRPVSVFSTMPDSEVWTRNATGFLRASPLEQPDLSGFSAHRWPPAGAERIDVSGFYEDRTAAGMVYGPIFQNMRDAWRRSGEVFADVLLPETVEVAGFGIHPALFDAVLHASVLCPGETDGETAGSPRLPFAWAGVEVSATGARAVRVHATRTSTGIQITAVDPRNSPVLSIHSLTTRPATPPHPTHDALFHLAW
ncbi:type I polyketide synthase, partial [Frankia sp. Mgl5]|uniref:type I polyketide synthase n=1 Tax=Frankia sp. Mgl5 TaxID=2933793 RepID=UPI00200F9891